MAYTNNQESGKSLNNQISPSYTFKKINELYVLVDYNQSANEITNGEVRSHLGADISVILSDCPDVLEDFKQCFNKKQVLVRKYRYQEKISGKERYVTARYFHFPPDKIIVHTDDITQQVLTEQKLQNTEIIFKDLFDRSPYSIVLLEMDGTIIDSNPATRQLFGYNRADLIGKRFLDLTLYPTKNLKSLVPRFKQILKGELVGTLEYEIYKKNGEIAWINALPSLIHLKNKSMIQAIVWDVTENKKNEKLIEHNLKTEKALSTISSRFVGDVNIDEAIKESLKDMALICDAEGIRLLIYDEDGNLASFLHYFSDNEIKIDPYSLEEMDPSNFPWATDFYVKNEYIYIPDVNLLPQEAKLLKYDMIRRGLNSILLFPVKLDGEVRGFIRFENFQQPKVISEAECIMIRTCSEIIGNALDRKWKDETLRASQELLTGILSSLTEAILLIDNRYNVIWMNNVAENLLDAKKNVNFCFELLNGKSEPCEQCVARKTFLDGKIHEKDFIMHDKEGKPISCWITSSPAALDLRGEVELVVYIIRDVTKFKHVQDKLKESKNRLKKLNLSLLNEIEERTRHIKESEELHKRILNDLDVGFYRGEYMGELLMYNRALNKILGIAPNQKLVGARSTKFFQNPNEMENYYNKLLKTGYVRNFHAEIKRLDGTRIIVELNSHLIRDETGAPTEIEGTVKLIREF